MQWYGTGCTLWLKKTLTAHTAPQTISGIVVYDMIWNRIFIMIELTLTEHTLTYDI